MAMGMGMRLLAVPSVTMFVLVMLIVDVGMLVFHRCVVMQRIEVTHWHGVIMRKPPQEYPSFPNLPNNCLDQNRSVILTMSVTRGK